MSRHGEHHMISVYKKMGGEKGNLITEMDVRRIKSKMPQPHKRAFGGGGGSPVKFRKREGGLGDR